MTIDYDGSILGHPNGDIVDPGGPELQPGLTNATGKYGNRRSNASLQRHFRRPEGIGNREINRRFWETFINDSDSRYANAPNLNDVELRHSMHPNLQIPAEGDDLDSVSPAETGENSPVATPCTSWPLQGPTATSIGPAPDQNPSQASVDNTRANRIFVEDRKARYDD